MLITYKYLMLFMHVFLPFILSINASLDDLDPGLSQGPAGKELIAGLKTDIYHDQTQI